MWDIANHYTLAVNNAETMFATTSQEGYPKLAFINIQDNYELDMNFTVSFQSLYIQDGKFTSDDSFFVYLQQYTFTSYNLKKLNINTRQ